MKKAYQRPTTGIYLIHTDGRFLTGSNEVNNNRIDFNADTMGEGTGNDAAVKNYSVWDDNWN